MSEDDNFWNRSEIAEACKTFKSDQDEISQISSQDFFELRVQVKAQLKDNTSSERGVNFDLTKQCQLPLNSIISENALNNIVRSQCGFDLKGEYRADTDHFQPNISVTLKRLVVGRPCSLHHHKSLKAKTQLLDGAIAIGDGNAILAVILFLVQTLKKKLVYQMISSRPSAVTHYVNYLMTRLKTHELVDLLIMLGQSREAAMKQFQLIINSMGSSVDVLLNKLKNILSNLFTPPNMETFYINTLNNYIKLIEWQKSLGVSDLYNMSVLQCLAYSFLHHSHDANSKATSPQSLSQQYQISPMQYEWTILYVHSKMKNWDSVDNLFIVKNFFGRKTLSLSVPLPKVIRLLKDSGATSVLLDKYLNHISSIDQRLEVAKKYKVHRTVIDCLVLKNDRKELTQYKMTLHPQSEEYFHAENALRTVVQK